MNRRDFLKLAGPGTVLLGGAGCAWLRGGDDTSLAEIYGVGEEYLHFDDSGNAYEILSGKHIVRKNNSDGTVAWEIGGYGDEEHHLNYPVAIEVDAAGHVYVVDHGNGRVAVYDADGNYLRQVGDEIDANEDSELDFPRHLAIDHQNYLYVCDSRDHHIQVFDPEGQPVREFGYAGDDETELNNPRAVEIDPQGNIHVVDAQNARIQVFDPYGHHLRSYGTGGEGQGALKHPRSLVIDNNGNSYVVDSADMNVEVFGPDGTSLAELEVTFSDGTAGSPLYVSRAPGDQIYITANRIE